MPKRATEQKAHAWVRTILIIAGVGAIIFFLLWVMCMWDDDDCSTHPFILDLDLPGPGFICCPGSEGGGGLYDEPPEDEDTCPPINTKMKAALPTHMAAMEAACRTSGSLWFDSISQIACQDVLARIDCRDLEYNPATSADYALTRNTCHLQGGSWLCAPTYIGCHCGGSGNPPSYECSYIWSTIGGGRCSGGCEDTTDICKEIEGECVCFDEDDGEITCGAMFSGGDPATCYGVCPEWEECAYISGGFGDPTCVCTPPL